MTFERAIEITEDAGGFRSQVEQIEFYALCGDALRKSEKLDKLIEKVEEVWKTAPVCDTCHKGIAVYRWEEVNDDLEEVTYQECTACHKKRIQKMMEKFVN